MHTHIIVWVVIDRFESIEKVYTLSQMGQIYFSFKNRLFLYWNMKPAMNRFVIDYEGRLDIHTRIITYSEFQNIFDTLLK